MKKSLLVVIFLFCVLAVNAQQFFRIKTDFSIKQKNADNTTSLTLGTAYYDKLNKKLIYKITFPEKETWVFKDTVMYVFKNDKFFTKKKSILLPEFTIFHLALNNKLADFGLKDSPFQISKIEKDKGMVITTYTPNSKVAASMGKVLLSTIEKKLNGVIFYTPKNEIASKIFYKKYSDFSGLSFPTTVTQFTYSKGENIQQTTYKNIVVDQMGDDNIYNYSIKGF
jgi:hypothetical protein